MSVNCGPTSRGDMPATALTIREVVLLEIYKAMLTNGKIAGLKPTLEKAQEATAYYLQVIDPNLNKLPVKLNRDEGEEE